MAALLEGEQPLDLVGIVAGKAAGHDFAAAARLDGNVGKEDVLIDVDAMAPKRICVSLQPMIFGLRWVTVSSSSSIMISSGNTAFPSPDTLLAVNVYLDIGLKMFCLAIVMIIYWGEFSKSVTSVFFT